MLDVNVLGPLVVRSRTHAQRPSGAKLRAILAVLALSPGDVVLRDQLVDELGLAESSQNATNTLQAHIVRLRNWLHLHFDARHLLVTCESGYLLDLAPGRVDASRFVRAVDDARSRHPGDPGALAGALAAALACWRGPALADVGDGAICRLATHTLHELRVTAQEDLVDLQMASGEERAAIAELEQLIAQNPLREGLWEQLMLALYRCGRHAEAIQRYHRIRRLLDEELGLQPGPGLQRRLTQILNHEPALRLTDERSAIP